MGILSAIKIHVIVLLIDVMVLYYPQNIDISQMMKGVQLYMYIVEIQMYIQCIWNDAVLHLYVHVCLSM